MRSLVSPKLLKYYNPLPFGSKLLFVCLGVWLAGCVGCFGLCLLTWLFSHLLVCSSIYLSVLFAWSFVLSIIWSFVCLCLIACFVSSDYSFTYLFVWLFDHLLKMIQILSWLFDCLIVLVYFRLIVIFVCLLVDSLVSLFASLLACLSVYFVQSVG